MFQICFLFLCVFSFAVPKRTRQSSCLSQPCHGQFTVTAHECALHGLELSSGYLRWVVLCLFVVVVVVFVCCF